MPGLARSMSASSSLPKMLTGVTAALDGDLLVGVTEPVCIGVGGRRENSIHCTIISHGVEQSFMNVLKTKAIPNLGEPIPVHAQSLMHTTETSKDLAQ